MPHETPLGTKQVRCWLDLIYPNIFKMVAKQYEVDIFILEAFGATYCINVRVLTL